MQRFRCHIDPRCLRRVTAGLVILLAGAAAPIAAHEELAGRLLIEHPWAVPAKAGDSTQLYMRIINYGHGPIHLLGLRTALAERARIMFRAAPGKIGTLDSVLIESGGSLGLDTSHMWIEISRLKQDLRPGESFSATVEFSDGSHAPVSVVVGKTHPGGGSGQHES